MASVIETKSRSKRNPSKKGFIGRHLRAFAAAEGVALLAGGGYALHGALAENAPQEQIYALDQGQTAGESAAWKLAYGTKGVRTIGEHSVPTGSVEPDPNAAIEDLRVQIQKIIESHANDSDKTVQEIIGSVEANKIKPGYPYVDEREKIAVTLDSMEQSKQPLRVAAKARAEEKANDIARGVKTIAALPVLLGLSIGLKLAAIGAKDKMVRIVRSRRTHTPPPEYTGPEVFPPVIRASSIDESWKLHREQTKK